MNKYEPAFPSQNDRQYFHGISKRDYFAAKAMQGICASGPGVQITNERIAKEAYEIADAMLAARTQKPENQHA